MSDSQVVKKDLMQVYCTCEGKTDIQNGIHRSSRQLVVLDDLISKHLVLTPRGPETSNSKMLTCWQFIQATSQHTAHEEIRLLPINYRRAVENGL